MTETLPGAPADFIARVRSNLVAALAPSVLEIRDETARHAGHREAAGRFHLNVRIVSQRFTGLPALARHRLVNEALSGEFAGALHALSVTAQAPEEAPAR
ncbi:MAG: BolA family protein [Gammaproteobacteria bacterium]